MGEVLERPDAMGGAGPGGEAGMGGAVFTAGGPGGEGGEDPLFEIV